MIKKIISICLCSMGIVLTSGLETTAFTKEEVVRLREELYQNIDTDPKVTIDFFYSRLKPFFIDIEDGEVYRAMYGLLRIMKLYYGSTELESMLERMDADCKEFLLERKINSLVDKIVINRHSLSICFCYNVVRKGMNYDEAWDNILDMLQNEDIGQLLLKSCNNFELSILKSKGIIDIN